MLTRLHPPLGRLRRTYAPSRDDDDDPEAVARKKAKREAERKAAEEARQKLRELPEAKLNVDDEDFEDKRMAVTGAYEAHMTRVKGAVVGEVPETSVARLYLQVCGGTRCHEAVPRTRACDGTVPCPHGHPTSLLSRALVLCKADTRFPPAPCPLTTCLQHPAPPLEALKKRLMNMSAGLTESKVDNMLAENPSKRLLCQWLSTFPSREHLSAYLVEHYDVCLWHAPLLASRLLQMRRTDLEFGIIDRNISKLQVR